MGVQGRRWRRHSWDASCKAEINDGPKAMGVMILADGPLSGWWSDYVKGWWWLMTLACCLAPFDYSCILCIHTSVLNTRHGHSSLSHRFLFVCCSHCSWLIEPVSVKCCERPQTIWFSRAQLSFDSHLRYSHCHIISGLALNKHSQGQPNEGQGS